jgi:hypothetical protein
VAWSLWLARETVVIAADRHSLRVAGGSEVTRGRYSHGGRLDAIGFLDREGSRPVWARADAVRCGDRRRGTRAELWQGVR